MAAVVAVRPQGGRYTVRCPGCTRVHEHHQAGPQRPRYSALYRVIPERRGIRQAGDRTSKAGGVSHGDGAEQGGEAPGRQSEGAGPGDPPAAGSTSPQTPVRQAGQNAPS